ncbi:MAG: hypothetical protein ACLQAH_04655 [Limisphaerales bacterium]
MKTFLGLFIAGVLLAFATGCSTTKQTQQTENLLLASGFKLVAAATPAQQAHLQTLPPGKITVTKRNGKIWYVYPDAARRQLYVGNPGQYQTYRQYRQNEQLLDEQLDTTYLKEDSAGWNSWAFGDFGE